MPLPDFFTIRDNNYAFPSEHARAIDIFRDIIARDRGTSGDNDGRKKMRSVRELSYIYHMEDPRSPFQDYRRETRKKKIMKTVFANDQGWEPDELIDRACDFYAELCETKYTKLLKSCFKAADSMMDFLEHVDLGERDNNNKPVHKITDITRALKEVDEVVESLYSTEEKVKSLVSRASGKTRGDIKKTPFNG